MFNIKVPRYLFGVTFFVFKAQKVETTLASEPNNARETTLSKAVCLLEVCRWTFFLRAVEASFLCGLDFHGFLQ